ncbi:uncharacterized protein TRIADDRAFT_57753 [Trichoplax adhaerens]|uniref:Uncharacterized protein n=1 Tax=Trichoplax adhaerens TaxID=10228 RepID=B3S0B5_TRIAD|nr:predicted protein [Trichoplax adhaerens]EDV24355.1 predicted protein [Trichoplax adhaerens]|eukprot:XP_002113881.1 predicted protein [Trichoplax adhaerens]
MSYCMVISGRVVMFRRSKFSQSNQEFEAAANLGHPVARFCKWELISAEDDFEDEKHGELKVVKITANDFMQNYGGGDSGTAFALGIVYAHGIGVEKDLQRAAHFFARNILDECRLYTYSSLYEIAKLQH